MKWASFAAFAEYNIHSFGEVKALTQEKLCIFIVALVARHPSELEDAFSECFG